MRDQIGMAVVVDVAKRSAAARVAVVENNMLISEEVVVKVKKLLL